MPETGCDMWAEVLPDTGSPATADALPATFHGRLHVRGVAEERRARTGSAASYLGPLRAG